MALTEMESDNFRISTSVLSGGSAPMNSGNYQMNSTLGQPTPLIDGDVIPLSTNYELYPGFWYTLPVMEGNLDGDCDVDRDDLDILLGHRNQPASECAECDLDGDGTITVLDARKLVLLCTRPRCACD